MRATAETFFSFCATARWETFPSAAPLKVRGAEEKEEEEEMTARHSLLCHQVFLTVAAGVVGRDIKLITCRKRLSSVTVIAARAAATSAYS